MSDGLAAQNLNNKFNFISCVVTYHLSLALHFMDLLMSTNSSPCRVWGPGVCVFDASWLASGVGGPRWWRALPVFAFVVWRVQRPDACRLVAVVPT